MKIFGLQVPFTKGTDVVTTGNGALTPLRGSTGLLGFIRESFPGAWQRNITLDNNQTLLACAPVYACISRIATDIAKLRIRLVEQRAGIWIEVEGTSPFWGVLEKPNAFQNRIQFMMAWLVSKLMFGNLYVLKERDQRGIVTAMYVLDPRLVTPLVASDGGVYYKLGRDDLSGVKPTGITVPASEIIHDRGMCLWHPLIGVSPLYACAAAGTQASRIQANSATFFENMSRPSGILSGPGVIDDVTADRLKKGNEENFSKGNIGRLMVLGDGLNYTPMTIPAEQSQLIEQLKWTGEDIARAFGVPGYKIGVGQMPTNNNVEALNQQYYDGCLQILIESIELCLDEGMGLVNVSGKNLGTEFDLDGLLRMDSAALAEAESKLVIGGIKAPDESRRRFNLPSVPGGASPYLQQQNYSLAALAKRDALADPFAQTTGETTPALPAEDKKSMLEEINRIVSDAMAARPEYDGIQKIADAIEATERSRREADAYAIKEREAVRESAVREAEIADALCEMLTTEEPALV